MLHGFDIAVMISLLTRPEFGSMSAMYTPAGYFSFLFLAATALFLPGVLQGYASTYRLPREDFFRACGRNLWRFIRLMIVAGTVMGTTAWTLFKLHEVLEQEAAESTNELLLPEVRLAGLAVIFLIMTAFRIWFDLAEADIVLSDQRAVRKSLWSGLRHTFRSLVRLMASYMVAAVVAAVVLVGGIWTWIKFVAPENVSGAFVVSQITLLLLLIPRFWQRGVAVSYWQQYMMAPVVAVRPVIRPAPAEVALEPPAPVVPPFATPGT